MKRSDLARAIAAQAGASLWMFAPDWWFPNIRSRLDRVTVARLDDWRTAGAELDNARGAS